MSHNPDLHLPVRRAGWPEMRQSGILPNKRHLLKVVTTPRDDVTAQHTDMRLALICEFLLFHG